MEYVYELQDHFNFLCSAVTGRFCKVLSMVAHRKVSAESFDILLLLVNFSRQDNDLLPEKSWRLMSVCFVCPPFRQIHLHSLDGSIHFTDRKYEYLRIVCFPLHSLIEAP